MKATNIALLSVLLIIIWLTPYSVYSQVNKRETKYSLERFLADVKVKNHAIKIAGKERDYEKLRRQEVLSELLPNIYIEGSYSRQLRDEYIYLDFPDFFTGEVITQKFRSSFKNNFYATAIIEQSLFDLPALLGYSNLSNHVEICENLYDAKKVSVLTLAQKTFYLALFLKKCYNLMECIEADNNQIFTAEKSRFENGLLSEIDFLQSETIWKNSITDKLNARKNYVTALYTIKMIANIDTSEQIVIIGDLSNIPELPVLPSLSQTLMARSDYRALDNTVAFSEGMYATEVALFFPKVTASFNYQFSAMSDKWKLNENENNLLWAELKLSIPIFTGMYRWTKVEQSIINIEKATLEREKAEREIEVRLQELYYQLKELWSAIEAAKQSYTVAEKANNAAKVSYSEGLLSYMQMTNISNEFRKASINYYQTIYSYLDAYTEWEYETGSLTIE